jgi:hypothetical protein
MMVASACPADQGNLDPRHYVWLTGGSTVGYAAAREGTEAVTVVVTRRRKDPAQQIAGLGENIGVVHRHPN